MCTALKHAAPVSRWCAVVRGVAVFAGFAGAVLRKQRQRTFPPGGSFRWTDGAGETRMDGHCGCMDWNWWCRLLASQTGRLCLACVRRTDLPSVVYFWWNMHPCGPPKSCKASSASMTSNSSSAVVAPVGIYAPPIANPNSGWTEAVHLSARCNPFCVR